MFRKFSAEEDVSSQSKVKSSVQRGIVKAIKEQYTEYGLREDVLQELFPKKEPMMIAKCQNHINLVLSNSDGAKEVVFFNQREGPYFPCLKVLHKAGDFMQKIYVDKGAIKHVIKGANIMCRGITGFRPQESYSIGVDQPVQIMAEGKELPLAVGLTKMSTDQMYAVNSGIGVEVIHVLGDGLWTMQELD